MKRPQSKAKFRANCEGSLYRNGPGLFERGGLRKPHLLDGDGLVQRLSFADGSVHLSERFRAHGEIRCGGKSRCFPLCDLVDAASGRFAR